MAGSRTLTFRLFTDASRFNSGFRSAERSTDRFGSKMGRLGGAAKAGLAGAGAAVTAFAVKLGVDSVKAAADFEQAIGKSEVIFGKAATTVQRFAETAVESFGISRQAALDGASTFAVFGKSAGLSGQELAKFGTRMTGLAGDLASFHNTKPEEAIEAIGAALRGEAEPIQRYGVLLNDATLRQEAMRLGLIKTTTQALTPQQKVLAAQAVILAQTKDAQGDFNRTSDQTANQQQILRARFENLKVTLGNKLLPVWNRVLTAVTGMTSGAGKASPAVNFLRQAFERLRPILEAIGKFYATIFKKALEGVKSAFTDIKKSVDKNRSSFQSVLPVITALYQFAANKLAPLIGGALKIYFTLLGKQIAFVVTVAGNLIAAFKGVWDWASKVISKIASIKLPGWMRKIGGFVGGLFSSPVSLYAAPVGGGLRAAVTPDAVAGALTPRITINVNGALDPTAVARQIRRLLTGYDLQTGRVQTLAG